MSFKTRQNEALAGMNDNLRNVSILIAQDWKDHSTFRWDASMFKLLYERSNIVPALHFIQENEFDCCIGEGQISFRFNSESKRKWCLIVRIIQFGKVPFEEQVFPRDNQITYMMPKDACEKLNKNDRIRFQIMYKDSEKRKPFDTSSVAHAPSVTVSHQSVDHASAVKQLTKDLKCLYNKSVYTDVVLKVGTGISRCSFRAHRAILCCRSPVFSKMFERETSETANSVIEITDVDSSVFEKFMVFLYSGELNEDDVDSLCGLYYAPDKYEVVQICVLCGNGLLSELDNDNVCRILALAGRHNDERLKTKVIEFMKGKLKDLSKTSGWSEYIITDVIMNDG